MGTQTEKDLWSQWGKERVGQIEIVSRKYIYILPYVKHSQWKFAILGAQTQCSDNIEGWDGGGRGQMYAYG